MEQRVQIIPGIGASEKEFTPIQTKVTAVSAFADWIQIDICDGVLVPNTTFLDPMPFRFLIEKTKNNFELHMMVADPFASIEHWIRSGFKRVYIHYESVESIKDDLKTRITSLKQLFPHVDFGLALDKQTPVDSVLPLLSYFDCALVMTIQAGFSGQQFIPELLDKVRTIHALKPFLPIEVDGGITTETALLAAAAGASRLVTTSFIFNAPDMKAAYEKLTEVQ